MRIRCDYIIQEIGKMALHKQVTKKKQYPINYTLVPGCYDKMLIHFDKKDNCWRVTHYSRWSESGKDTRLATVTARISPASGNYKYMRRSWTYQKKFAHEIEAMEFAKAKCIERKFDDPVILLQLDLDIPKPSNEIIDGPF